MLCKSCKSEIDDNLTWCPNCGANLKVYEDDSSDYELLLSKIGKNVVDYGNANNNEIIQLKILGGTFSRRIGVYNSSNNEIIVKDNGNENHINLNNLKSKQEVLEKYDDYSKMSGSVVGTICGFISAMYTFSTLSIYISDSQRIFESIASFIVSGLIWGGIAFIVGKLIKKQLKVIRLVSEDNLIFDIESEPIIHNYLMINSHTGDKTKQINMPNENQRKQPYSDEFDDKDLYKELIKLKELYDKKILTDTEFKKLKEKIISKWE